MEECALPCCSMSTVNYCMCFRTSNFTRKAQCFRTSAYPCYSRHQNEHQHRFLHLGEPQKAQSKKIYSIILTTDAPRTPLDGRNSCKPKMHEYIVPTVPRLQEEPEKVFKTHIWVQVGKGMEPQKHRQLEGVIAHEKVSCLGVSVALFLCPADQPRTELRPAHFSQPGCAPFVQ